MLELGKSLSLECTIRGFPIHQVVFRHNQNIIKSISGQAVSSQLRNQHQYFAPNGNQRDHSRQMKLQQQQQSRESGGYFVVDEMSNSFRQQQQQQAAQSAASELLAAAAAAAAANNNLEVDEPATGNSESDWAEHELAAQEIEQTNEAKLSHVVVIVLEPQHAGAYQCFAFNQYESTQSSTYIRVLDDPPKFKDTFGPAQVYEPSQEISLQCSARANPLPEITWSIDDQPIPESARTRFGDFVTKVSLAVSREKKINLFWGPSRKTQNQPRN